MEQKIEALRQVLGTSESQLTLYLTSLKQIPDSNVSLIQVYKFYVEKESLTYKTLNMLESNGNVNVGYFWTDKTLTEL